MNVHYREVIQRLNNMKCIERVFVIRRLHCMVDVGGGETLLSG
jgi:hypothetical protein